MSSTGTPKSRVAFSFAAVMRKSTMRSSSPRTASIITSESRLASLAARKRSSLTARASSVWRLSVMSSAWATRYAIEPSALRVALTWKRALTTVPSGCTKRVSRTKVRNSTRLEGAQPDPYPQAVLGVGGLDEGRRP